MSLDLEMPDADARPCPTPGCPQPARGGEICEKCAADDRADRRALVAELNGIRRLMELEVLCGSMTPEERARLVDAYRADFGLAPVDRNRPVPTLERTTISK